MAKTISDENIRLNIIINGNSAQKELLDLEKSTREYTAANKDLSAAKAKLVAEGKKETQEYKNITAEIKANNVVIGQNKTRMEALQKEIGVTGLTMNQLKQRAQQLRLQLNNAIPGGEAAKKYGAELTEVTARINELKGSAGNATTTFSKFKDGLASVGFPVSAAMLFTQAITGTINKLKEMVTANIDLEESQANVMKTTGYTKQQVDALTESLKKLNTKTPINELLGLAEAGGRINLTGKELENFVKQTDIAFVALGDSLEGSAEEIGLILGKIAGNFDLDKKYGIGTSISKIGSSLNELGANSKATEAPMVDFIKRLAGVSQQAGIALPDLAALGALFDENGQSVEISATTFNTLLPAIGKDVERFAKIAGVNVTDFRKIVEEDAFEALVLVAKGAQSNQKGLEGLSETLENYGVDSARAASVVGILSSKTDRLTELQKISNDAFEDGTSISKEFGIKNETLGATLSKIGNTLAAQFTGSGVSNFLRGIAEGFFNIISPAEKSSVATEKERQSLFLIESKIKDVNTSNTDRLRLINDLKDQYPLLLANIDAETVSNAELTTSLKNVNSQLINKIILQDKDSEIEKQNKEIGKERVNLFKQEDEVRARLIKLADKHNITLKDNVTLQEQARAVIDKLGISGGVLVDPVAKLSHELSNLSVIQKNLNHEESKGNQLLAEKQGLFKRLNVSQDVLNPGGKKVAGVKVEEPAGNGVGGDEASGKALTEKLKATEAAQQKLAELEDKYEKEKLQRLAISNEAKAQLASDEAIAAAVALGAKKELLDTIEAEHKIKIDEAKLKDEEIELKRVADFEARKTALLNEIEVLNEETNLEKEILKTEQDFAKREAELETLRLTIEEKTQLETLLEESKGIALQRIRKKYKDAEIKQEVDLTKAKKKLQNDIINGAIDAAGRESRVGQALLAVKGILAAKDMLIQLGVLKSKAAISVAGATVATAEGAAQTAKVGFPYNIPLLIAFAAQAVGIIAAVKGAVSNAKSTKVEGFEDGLYPITREQDGKQFNASFGGQTSSGMVNKPTVFMAGENGPELIIDSAAYKQINPDIKYALHREIARVKGFENGYYPEASRQPASVDGVSSSNVNDEALRSLLFIVKENTDIMRELKESGVIAYLSNDLKNAKEMKDAIADYDKLRDKNKR